MNESLRFLQGRWAAVTLLRNADTPEQIEAAQVIIESIRRETGYFNPLHTIPEEARNEITAAMLDRDNPLNP